MTDDKQTPAMEDERAPSSIAVCPYFTRDYGSSLRVSCECARFKFPDKETRREIFYGLCAHPEGYKTCPIKVAMDHHYSRLYKQEVET